MLICWRSLHKKALKATHPVFFFQIILLFHENHIQLDDPGRVGGIRYKTQLQVMGCLVPCEALQVSAAIWISFMVPTPYL